MSLLAFLAAVAASIALRCALDLYAALNDPPEIWGDE